MGSASLFLPAFSLVTPAHTHTQASGPCGDIDHLVY